MFCYVCGQSVRNRLPAGGPRAQQPLLGPVLIGPQNLCDVVYPSDGATDCGYIPVFKSSGSIKELGGSN